MPKIRESYSRFGTNEMNEVYIDVLIETYLDNRYLDRLITVTDEKNTLTHM